MKARYKALVDSFAEDIHSGKLPAGTRLPTHRRLAAEQRISLATATRVYGELEAAGLVSGETGRGTFVRELALPAGQGVDQYAIATDVLDLNFNYPSLPEQAELLRKALRQLSGAGDIEAMLRYQPHGGRYQERSIFTQYLAGQGVHCTPENVLIVNGIQHGLTVTIMGLLKPGDVVAVDMFTYPGFKVLAEQFHIELLPVRGNARGLDPDDLEKQCQTRRIRAVYTMPTLHNPLGIVMDEATRRQLAEVARRYDLLLIEDAAYAWMVDDAPAPLHCAAPERTVYLSGFSKNVATGLRVAMVVVPEGKNAPVERAIRATTWNTPVVMAAIVSNWIQDGTVDRLEAAKKQDARQRQRRARAILEPLVYQSYPCSWFIWLPLGEEVRADRVASALLKEKITVSTAAPFCTSTHIPHALRLALGSVTMGELERAVQSARDIIDYYSAW
ncbi:PLP-dependent aminotransferase family protein [Entomohabitans teleogrylli]|uniref:aminotransferase-like domain-containing protein n=1 Tax=Entomohabitans teleogrylli TaxID=1384589 RepID=UPI00073D55BB|nr:aminotransferase class I/II-fold pyridoxal phosphate-dependent enzyme [Entomohabitans teleogrylli]